jgi:hypothetical protein
MYSLKKRTLWTLDRGLWTLDPGTSLQALHSGTFAVPATNAITRQIQNGTPKP